MSDLDLLIAGAMVTFLSVAGAYIAIRHRANEAPVDSYRELEDHAVTQGGIRDARPGAQRSPQHATVEARMR